MTELTPYTAFLPTTFSNRHILSYQRLYLGRTKDFHKHSKTPELEKFEKQIQKYSRHQNEFLHYSFFPNQQKTTKIVISPFKYKKFRADKYQKISCDDASDVFLEDFLNLWFNFFPFSLFSTISIFSLFFIFHHLNFFPFLYFPPSQFFSLFFIFHHLIFSLFFIFHHRKVIKSFRDTPPPSHTQTCFLYLPHFFATEIPTNLMTLSVPLTNFPRWE